MKNTNADSIVCYLLVGIIICVCTNEFKESSENKLMSVVEKGEKKFIFSLAVTSLYHQRAS